MCAEPMLRAFDELALGMEIRTAMSMSGSLGKADLQVSKICSGPAHLTHRVRLMHLRSTH